MERYRDQLLAQLTAVADDKRAVSERAYLRVPERFSVLGVSLPHLRRITKTFAREHHDMPAAELIELARALYFGAAPPTPSDKRAKPHAAPSHDLRSAAIGILEYSGAKLSASETLRANVFAMLVDFARDAYTWAHIDWLSTAVASPLVIASPRLHARRNRALHPQSHRLDAARNCQASPTARA